MGAECDFSVAVVFRPRMDGAVGFRVVNAEDFLQLSLGVDDDEFVDVIIACLTTANALDRSGGGAG